jgi:uncharacterized protein
VSLDLRDATLPAAQVIAALGLAPHPEGGHYRELWRDGAQEGPRGAASAIHFLLAAGERSHWHRVDAAELWLWQGGAPLALRIGREQVLRLGPDAASGEALLGVVPAGDWQAAEPLGAWSLVSCVVAPAFRFSGFELAPAGFSP